MNALLIVLVAIEVEHLHNFIRRSKRLELRTFQSSIDLSVIHTHPTTNSSESFDYIFVEALAHRLKVV